jgi:hypothetical protein
MTYKAKPLRLASLVAIGAIVATALVSRAANDATAPSSDKPGTSPITAAPPSPGTTDTPGPASVPLTGNVQMVHLNLEKLRDLGLDLKHLLKASSSLYDEVTVQPVQIVTEPDYIGNGIVINIPVSTRPIGPAQPPKPERVEMAMSGIRPVVAMLKQDVDDFESGHKQLDLPADVKDELKSQFTQWVANVNALSAKESQLEQLTKGPTFDNQAIASESTALQNNVKALDETRRSIYKVLHKERKRLLDQD